MRGQTAGVLDQQDRMSSFFTVPGSHSKRKRADGPVKSQKRFAASKPNGKPAAKAPRPRVKRAERDESISGSDSDEDESAVHASDAGEGSGQDESGSERETAAEKRRRLAERYLENVKEHVDDAGFDAADIDRDLIAERLQEDIAETKGKVYRRLASELAFDTASRTIFRTNTNTVTSVAAHDPYFYTVTKDVFLHKWRTQDLPQYQYSQTTRRRPKTPPAPPRKRPELKSWIRGDVCKARERSYKRHTGRILAVAASPDGKYVVTGGEDKKIIVYDSNTLKTIKVLTHHRDAVTGLVFRRGTNQLYSCSKDRTVKVWSLDEMAYVETLFGHQDEILDVDALAQERCVSVGARDRTARLWKVIEETQLVFRGGALDKKPRPGVNPRALLHEGSVDRIALIDDDLFVTGSDNGSIALWNVQKKKPIYIEPIAHGLDPPLKPEEASAEEHPGSEVVPTPTPRWITALKTIPYSDVILSGSWDGYIRVWRLSEDKKKLEAVGTLGGPQHGAEQDQHVTNGETTTSTPETPIPGVVNDIAFFERNDRGQDGLCVIAAVGKDHRLGRWKAGKSVRNGGVIYEVCRKPKSPANGATGSPHAEEED